MLSVKLLTIQMRRPPTNVSKALTSLPARLRKSP